METRGNIAFKKYKPVCDKIRNEMRKLQKEKQHDVALQCKQNPKAFWKYINSKWKCKIGIWDLNSVDVNDNPVAVSNSMEKAEELGNFLWSVFTIEQELSNTAIPHRPYHFHGEQLIFSEQLILDIAKSPGPDGIHPRILYELQYMNY